MLRWLCAVALFLAPGACASRGLFHAQAAGASAAEGRHAQAVAPSQQQPQQGAEHQEPMPSLHGAVRPPAWLDSCLNPKAEGLHNNLPELAKTVAQENWVSFFSYNLGVRDFFLNMLYSYLHHGDARHYLVATSGPAVMQDCLAMRMPCYNATGDFLEVATIAGATQEEALSSNTQEQYHAFGSRTMMLITWTRVKVALTLLKLGYNVHYSDTDVVYMRKVLPSVEGIMRYHPDATFLWEENYDDSEESLQYINIVNSGVFFVRPSVRTIGLFTAWLARAAVFRNDQNGLNDILHEVAATCDTGASCLHVRRANKTAVMRHPSLYKGGRSCYLESLPDVCDDRRLYIHVLCTTGRHSKIKILRNQGLWFLADPMGNEIDTSQLLHDVLPCKEPDADVAWKKDLLWYFSQ